MDLKKMLMSGHTTAVKDQVVNYVNGDQRRFDELVKLFLKDDQRVTQRAAWPVGEIGSIYPELVIKHIAQMVVKLREEKLHDAVPRNIMRIFQVVEIPEKYCAEVLDQCFGFIKSEAVAVAIRANAITVAMNICRRFPDLIHEFRLLLDEIQTVPQSPAMKVRIKRATIFLRG